MSIRHPRSLKWRLVTWVAAAQGAMFALLILAMTGVIGALWMRGSISSGIYERSTIEALTEAVGRGARGELILRPAPELERLRRYIPRRTAGGTVDGFFVLVTDIAERQRARADLQEAEDRLRLALEGAGTGIYDYDLVTGALTWDARTRALFGLSADDPVSYEGAFLPGVHSDDRERADRAVQAAIGSPEGFDIEYRVFGRRDGAERVLAARGSTVFRDGAPVRFVGTVRDITEARTAEARARRLAALVEQSSDFIGLADLDGRAEFLNEAVTAAFDCVQSGLVQDTGADRADLEPSWIH